MICDQKYGDMMADKFIELAKQDNFINLYSISCNLSVGTVDGAVAFWPWARSLHLRQDIDILNRTDVPDDKTLSKRFGNWGNPKGPLEFIVTADPQSWYKYNELENVIQSAYHKQQKELKRGLKIAQTPEFYAALAELTKQCFTLPERKYANSLLDLVTQYTK